MLILDIHDFIHVSIYLQKLSITQKFLPLWPNSETSFTLYMQKSSNVIKKQNKTKQSTDYMLGFTGMYIKFDDVHVKSEYRYNLSKLGDIWLICSKIVVLDACRHLFCLATSRACQFLNISNIFPKYT